eukprot:1011183-Prymnesium_polylepis.2
MALNRPHHRLNRVGQMIKEILRIEDELTRVRERTSLSGDGPRRRTFRRATFFEAAGSCGLQSHRVCSSPLRDLTACSAHHNGQVAPNGVARPRGAAGHALLGDAAWVAYPASAGRCETNESQPGPTSCAHQLSLLGSRKPLQRSHVERIPAEQLVCSGRHDDPREVERVDGYAAVKWRRRHIRVHH